MLRTNLSTRPFYNERLVQFALGTVALIALGLTVFNVVQVRTLTLRQGQLLGRVGAAERQAVKLRGDADHARRSLNREELDRVAAAAREANALIDARTFSWTELLNRLEVTLPDDLRVKSIRPMADQDGNLTVEMALVGRRPEDVAQFMEQLEATSAFSHVYSRTEATNAQGQLEVRLEARYDAWPGAPTRKSGRAGQAQAGKPRTAREN
jgi:Tfp pilus assembly protein PilN